ncbi:unnamed protein product [Ilex paraguariensis]|uniref:Wound-responsive family protein n=1 Tax=Ilex paraguariensis TaxID=185542 RepID=A0ABC8SWU4_9AQUA
MALESTLLPNQQPKKRRRKDLSKDHCGSGGGLVLTKHVKVGKKAAGKSELSVGKNSTSLSHSMSVPSVHCEDTKFQNQINASETFSKKKSADGKAILPPSHSIVSNGYAMVEEKDTDKLKTLVLPSKTPDDKLKEGSELFDTSNHMSLEKSSDVQYKSQPGKSLNYIDDLNQSFQLKEKNGICERTDVGVPGDKHSMQTVKTPLMQRKEGSSVRPKSTMLEKAIRDLEKMVTESRPPTMEVPDTDISSQAIKRRLSPEIKQKLAKVARLAQASQGKISQELISRLMSFVGHLVHIRTLKRNLKNMVEIGLSAKQEKDDRFQQIKKDVVEMIKLQVPLMKSKILEEQTGASDSFQEIDTKEKEVLKRKCSMDDALEDKICDLYDLYVDGLDEDAGRQARKLYAELAKLWPSGFMDNHGIKRAICRAKDRKRAFYSRHKVSSVCVVVLIGNSSVCHRNVVRLLLVY